MNLQRARAPHAQEHFEVGGTPVIKVTTLVHALEGMPEDLDNYMGKTERDIRVRWLVADKPGDPVGTGPWKTKKGPSKDMIILEPSGKGVQPQDLDEVHLPAIPGGDQLVERLGLDADDPRCVHFAPIVTDPKSINALRNNSRVQLIDLPGLSLFYLGFYTDQKPFSNGHLRKAVVSSIDTNALAAVAYGTAVPAVSPVPPNMLGYDPKIKQLPHDPERAKRFLDESNYGTGSPLTFLYFKPTSYAKDLAMAVAGQISGCLGLKVVPNELPNWETLVDAVKARRGDMFLYSWHQRVPHPNDPREFLTALFHSRNRGTTNLTWYRNDDVDRLLDSGTPKDLHETQQKIVADAPMAFLSHPRRVSAINKAVKNIRMNGDGLPEDKLVMVKIDK